MAEHNMDHLNHLQAVADSDVEVLRKKEATYQGSWKRAGGRSAWFMARRNLDRLITMMAPPKATIRQEAFSPFEDGKVTLTRKEFENFQALLRAEDIFLMIERDPSGDDGTVLAVVRDARRYFTLVEAEMIARGVVKPEGGRKIAKDPNLAAPYGSGGAGGYYSRNHVSSGVTSVQGEGGAGEPRERTPEDGGQHEALSPWVRPTPQDELWYRHHSIFCWVLHPFVVHGTIPSGLKDLYDDVLDGFLLKIGLCPPDARNMFPSLPMERNFVELRDAPAWQCDLYREEETKHVLINRAWHNPAEG